MKTTALLPAALAVLACAGVSTAQSDADVSNATSVSEDQRTAWRVHASLGLDALLALGALSGDVMQAEIYPGEIADLSSRLTPDELAGLAAFGQMAQQTGTLVGPFLALVFSVNDTDSLDAVIASAEDPETRLRRGFEATPYWNAERWPRVSEALQGPVATTLRAFRRTGFEDDWRALMDEAGIDSVIANYVATLAGHDVIAEQQRLLGRPLAPEIELIVLHYSMPYGIRITGQRFLSHHSYDPNIQLRTAAHEIFHPPFDRSDEALIASLVTLRDDPWMVSIVDDHDPRFGYDTFLGVLDEDSAEALDQIVSERLGFARDPGERWRRHDEGMHMLAAALYRAMLDDGFDETGGRYEDWLRGAVARGVLEPENVRRLAAEVVGEEAVNAWGPHRGAEAEDEAH